MLSVREIAKRLADRAEEVCRLLLPGGKTVKNEWHAGDLSGGAGTSLKVHLTGQHAGKWRDWASDADKGDMLDLWRMVQGIPLPDAIKQAKDFLGIVDHFFVAPKDYSLPETNGVKPIDERGKAMTFLVHQRKISPEIINRFKVQGKPDSGAIVFPCYSIDGKLRNRSYRSLPRDGEKKKVWQDEKCAPCLFGWHVLDPAAFDTRTVLLCEGQIDAMTWTQWGIPALSIPNGSGQTWIEYEWPNLAAFDHIYLSFDMDGAGRSNSEKAIARLGKHRCLIVDIPEKDSNAALCAGFTAADAKRWIASARPPHVANLLVATELEKRALAEIAPKPEPFALPFFKIKWPHQGLYFREGESTLWTGISSHGKTTFIRYMTLLAIGKFGNNQTAFVASMETRPEREIVKMVTSLHACQADGDTIHDFLRVFGPRLVFADVLGYISQATLFEMMWFAFQRHGASHFVVDSLMRIEELEENYPAQGQFMNRIQEFAKASGGHVHIVCHPRKTEAGAKPSKMDIKGSSNLFNNADNVVTIMRNQEKTKMLRQGKLTPEMNRQLYDTEILVEKQRESGWEGSFFLKFDPTTHGFSPMDREAVEMARKDQAREKHPKGRRDIDG